MLSAWTEKRLTQQLTVIRLVWISMFFSLGTLGYVLFNKPQLEGVLPKTPAELMQDPNVQVLGAAAIAVLLLSKFAGRLVLNANTVRRFKTEPVSAESLRAMTAGKGGAPLYSEADIQTMLTLPEQERLMVRVAGPYFVSKILQFALCEACGILGFLIATTHHTPSAYLPFAGAAALGILSSAPRKSEILDISKMN